MHARHALPRTSGFRCRRRAAMSSENQIVSLPYPNVPVGGTRAATSSGDYIPSCSGSAARKDSIFFSSTRKNSAVHCYAKLFPCQWDLNLRRRWSNGRRCKSGGKWVSIALLSTICVAGGVENLIRSDIMSRMRFGDSNRLGSTSRKPCPGLAG